MSTEQELRAQVRSLQDENAGLRELLDGKWPSGAWRMQSKIDRQRYALDRLQRRVENQRLVLRTIESLGRGLTDDEWAAAKASVEPEALRARMEDRTPTAA